MIERISAVTLATHNTGHAVRFYASLGFGILYGGEASPLTSTSRWPRLSCRR